MSRQISIASLLAALMIVSGCRSEADTPLTIAAARGDTKEVQTLLARGADVNGKDSSGWTPLMWAARDGHTDAMKSLLDAGADINIKDSGTNGWTALLFAIHKNQNQAARLLLDGGADVNAKARGGATPLMFAAGYDNTEMVRALLAKGADPYAEAGGHTVLSNAVGGAWDIDRPTADRCPTATVKLLFEKAPDLRLKNDVWGRSALFFAKRKGCSEIVTLLEQRQNFRQVADAK